jgi:hypothetical protein
MTLDDSSESESTKQMGIDRCVTLLPIEDSHNCEGNVTANTCLSFHGSGTDVRRPMEVRMLKEWSIGRNGFNFEHIKSSRGKNAGLKSLKQGRFINNATSGAVHDVVATVDAIV